MPCDIDRNDLPLGTLPSVPILDGSPSLSDTWDPFDGQEHFELADFLYRCNQMSAGDINELLGLWNGLLPDDAELPFASHDHLYSLIDKITLGDVKWQSMTASYQHNTCSNINDEMPSWMMKTYDVWFQDPCELLQNQLVNQDFDGNIDYAPQQVFNALDKWVWSDFMTRCWAWDQVVCPSQISSDRSSHC